jgi:hypothetical protein
MYSDARCTSVSFFKKHTSGFWFSIPGGGWEFFSSPPRPEQLWGLTQPPIQWVPGAPSLGVKRPVREANHSPPSSAEVKE